MNSAVIKLKNDCIQKFNILHELHTSYGAETSTVQNIYRAIIQSELDYGTTACSSACKILLHSLDAIQHTSLRIASSAYPTSPSISILSNLGEQPLQYRRQRLAMSYYLRTEAYQHIPQQRPLQ